MDVLDSCVSVLCGLYAAAGRSSGKAAIQGNPTELNRLLAHGPSASDRESALVWAARFGQPKSIAVLMKNSADPNTKWGVNDWTVLMHAIHKEQPQAVLAVLNNGANAKLAGGHGDTPLIMAAGYGYTDIVRILLQHGADGRATLPMAKPRSIER